MARSYPVVVIAPASLKLNWKREFMRWVPGIRVAILRGTKPNLTADAIRRAADVVIINYDILGDYDHPTKVDDKTGETVPDRSKPRRFTGWASVLADVNFSAVICDEIHVCRNKTSRRNRVTTGLVNTIDWCILLSGTPIVNRPAEMWPIIEMLHIQPVFGGQSKFERRYTGATKGRFGWDTSGAGNMAELNTIMRANGMVRRRKEDVLTELPPLTWADHVVELTPADRAEYDRAEADLANHIAGVKAERENIVVTIGAAADDQFPRPDSDDAIVLRTWARDREAWITATMGEWYRDTAQSSKRAEQLARFTYLRQLAARAKLKEAHAFIDTFHEAGEKVIVFGWHREFVTGLAEKYKAPSIVGGMRTESVESNKARFQSDPECMTIVLNIEAGGLGHTLTASSNVIFFEFGWNPAAMDQGAGRSHRIGQDKPVTAWRIIAADTIDEDFIAIIESKEVIVNEGTDGSIEQHASMMDAIRAKIMERQARRGKR
jgi:SWI/SNF-related matrix-associated actin-dependent regulator of chromatin subfamily A-like protein 1